MGVCNCSMFCCTLRYVHSSFAIILLGKRESYLLYSFCLPGGSVVVDFLFIVTPIVGVCNFLCFVVRYFMYILVLQSS